MEIERYTLATGETAVTGFNRLWRHWGLLLGRARVSGQPLARMGDQLDDAGQLYLRRKPDVDRGHQPARDGHRTDVRAKERQSTMA
jgi:hypothetical protein